jgi:sugar phosphate isomerase/epimerase
MSCTLTERTRNTTIFEMLLASTSPAVKFEMDCGWTAAAGYNPATFLNKYPDRICMLHIKAFQAGPPNLNLVGPNEPKPTELGYGKPDYEPIFVAAAKAQVEQYYIEQEPPSRECRRFRRSESITTICTRCHPEPPFRM